MIPSATPSNALALALFAFLLPQCRTLILNPFDMKVFLRSVSEISEKVKNMESLLVNSTTEMDTKLEKTRKYLEDKLASANEEHELFQSEALAAISSIRTSLNESRDKLDDNKKTWDDALVKLPSIESSLSATRTELAEIQETLNIENQCEFTGSKDIITASSLQQDIAFGKSTYAVSHYLKVDQYRPSKAVDGEMSSSFVSDLLWNPWWSVDFGYQSFVKEIFIQPRFEAYAERFHDVEIRLGNDLVQNGDFSSYKLLFFYQGPYTVDEGVLKCSFSENIRGRYLSIQIKNKKQYLQLNTVKVFA